MKIVDATNMIAGRMSTKIAKEILNGEDVVVVNAENAVISGSKETIMGKFIERYGRGNSANPYAGPYFTSKPDVLLRRMVRGMLPWKNPRGKNAFRKLKVFMGVPEDYSGKETVRFDEFDVSRLSTYKYMTIKDICALLPGQKVRA